jgi:hypothetical protein
VFEQMSNLTSALCALAGSSPITSSFAVTPEGDMQVSFLGIRYKGTAFIRVEKDGIWLHNVETGRDMKLLGLITVDGLKESLKNNMKQYL